MALRGLDLEENRRRMKNGDLYFSFAEDLVEDRKRCRIACEEYNHIKNPTRRQEVQLLQDIIGDKTAFPPPAPTEKEDEDLFSGFLWCDRPIKMDYGHNVKFGKDVYLNSNSCWIDSVPITVGDRVLFGPNCTIISGTHPTDPKVRAGINGPETGKPVVIGDDCWLGANVMVLPGVTIGRGTTIGAGSVVTKSIPPFMVAVGNPARVIKPIREVPAEELPPGWTPPADIPNSEVKQ